jgi:diacylglycerol kinase (ATP)
MRARNLRESLRYALAGVRYAFVTQRNMRIHLAAAVAVMAAGCALGLSTVELAVLTLTVSVVLTAELVNTSIETVVDLVTQRPNELARVAKNVAAGAVLVCAIGSVIVGMLLFVPHICRLL